MQDFFFWFLTIFLCNSFSIASLIDYNITFVMILDMCVGFLYLTWNNFQRGRKDNERRDLKSEET